MPKSILIDKKSMQIFGHFEKLIFNGYGTQIEPNPNFKGRLSRFFKILEKITDNITNNIIIDEITKYTLKNIDCLIILTRIRTFEPEEIDLIIKYLQNPTSNFLLMSNHNPDQLYDDVLSKKIGISLAGGYWSGEKNKYIKINHDCLSNHPIITGTESDESIASLVTNTTCRIESTYGKPLVYLPDYVEGRWSSFNEIKRKNKVFALIVDGKIDKNEYIKGKAVIIGDSGFIGDSGSIFPGYGLIDKGDNELFTKRVINWLLS